MRSADTMGDVEDETSARVHRHSRSVVWVETTAGRWAVADVSDFRQFVLNGTSGLLWRSFDGHSTDDAIVERVLDTYPDHPESARADCRALIDELLRLRLLELTDPHPDNEQAADAGMEL
ncbi:PqqD family protein [Microbacterium sp. X-17]|uniref:PqqD family protein n=1 Tax=Microbacterium sp. X-17 TaxID=3144404 RepID=UPI0031F4D258